MLEVVQDLPICLSSAIAFKGDFSCGGIDVLTYYFALRKSTSIGKYSVAINGFIVLLHTVLFCINDPARYDNAIIAANAVVVKDVPENAIMAGVPAKIIGYRDPNVFIM